MISGRRDFAHAERVHEAVLSGRQAAHSMVAASWCRSLLYHHLDPAQQARFELLDAAGIAHLREENGELLAVAQPILDALFASVGKAGCCVLLTDAHGTVLNARANESDMAIFAMLNLTSGANWSEASEGTNGIGTCLTEHRPVTIHRAEHFATRNIGVSCMDAPLFAPDGELVGALDVSSARRDHDEAMSDLISFIVQDATRQIERMFFCRRYEGSRIVYAPDQTGRGNALLALNNHGMVIGATRAARIKYKLRLEEAIHPVPFAELAGLHGPSNFDDAERAVLRHALARARGNVAAAARSLGIGRATFYRRMDRIGVGLVH